MPRLDSIFSSTPDVLSLSYIRSILQRLEDTILFQLIERGQNAHNAAMYKPGAFKELQEKEGWEKSWVEWFLKETESIHAKLRRWQAPDEYPFTDIKLLPEPILPPVEYPEVLYKLAIVTVNDQIYQHYRDELVPALTSRFGSVSLELIATNFFVLISLTTALGLGRQSVWQCCCSRCRSTGGAIQTDTLW
jgi:chorismate mutase